MRAMLTVAAGLLICCGLFGCNRTQAPVAAPVVAAAPVCNCPQQAQAALPAPLPQPAHPHRRHRAWSEHQSSSSYEGSSSYSSSGGEIREYDGAAMRSEDANGEAHAQAAVWIDGYGRSHYATNAADTDDANPAKLNAEDRHNRRAVWRGYNSKCGERTQ